MIKHAIQYGKMGFKVFPVNGKIPVIKGWQNLASCNEAELVELFKNPHTGLAVATGKASGITVLDVDTKNGVNGFETLKNAGIDLPITVVSLTPTGGKHYFFKYTAKLNNMVSILGKSSGLDIRNDGGYVILPPSKIDSKTYSYLEEQSLWN